MIHPNDPSHAHAHPNGCFRAQGQIRTDGLIAGAVAELPPNAQSVSKVPCLFSDSRAEDAHRSNQSLSGKENNSERDVPD